MEKNSFIFNVITYGIVILYILYINFASSMNKGLGLLRMTSKLVDNMIFRVIFLLIIGYLALDLCQYGGFILAILLTIAFLNTGMLSYKNNVENFISTNPERLHKLDLLGRDYDQTPEADLEPDEDEFERHDSQFQQHIHPKNYENFADSKINVINQQNKKITDYQKYEDMVQKSENCGPYAPMQRLPYNPSGYDEIQEMAFDGAPL